MQDTDENKDDDPYDDKADWTTIAAHAFHHNDPAEQPEEDSKPPAQQNQFAPLAEQLFDNDEHNHDDKMETEDDDDRSRSLIPDDQEDEATDVDNNNEQQYSAATGHEIELIVQYVRHNRPSRLPELTEYLAQTESFSNDTDAQDAWRYAQSLVQTDDRHVAGPRTSHDVPHGKWAKGPNE